MKKTIIMFLCLFALLTLSACAGKYSIDKKSPCACNYDFETIS